MFCFTIKNRINFISKGGFFDNEKFETRRTKKTLEKKHLL